MVIFESIKLGTSCYCAALEIEVAVNDAAQAKNARRLRGAGPLCIVGAAATPAQLHWSVQLPASQLQAQEQRTTAAGLAFQVECRDQCCARRLCLLSSPSDGSKPQAAGCKHRLQARTCMIQM